MFSEVAVSATLTALKTSTSYRFRITAKNTVATSVAAERVLVTLPKLPPGAGTVGFPDVLFPTEKASPATEGAPR